MNSGRGATDLVAIAGGNDWDGDRAYSDNSPTSDDVGNVDLSTLSKDKLIQARQDLYQGRIDGLQAKVDELGADAIEPNSGKTYGTLVKEAQKGYDNSQKYRAGGQDIKQTTTEEEQPNIDATSETIVADIKDGINALKGKYNKQLPSMTTLITGPSRTADIEKTLVMGAHGPKELYLFFIDDSIN